MNCDCGGIFVENTNGEWECIRCGKRMGKASAWGAGGGDAAGEHLSMVHGRYSAWVYVVLAFMLEMAVGTFLIAAAFEALARALFPSLAGWAFGVGLAGGLALAIGVFWDRWRCTEAFASNYCAGCVNVSILYVPFIAFGYANSRGIPRLFRVLTRRRRG
jgi:hypothetical protein